MNPLHPKVLAQLTRLKGTIGSDFAVADLTVDTPVGPRSVPASIQALLAVEWPEGHVLLTKDEFEWEVDFGGSIETESGTTEVDRAWLGIGYDEGQFYLLVDLDQAAGSDDPYVYRVDHEGDQPVPEPGDPADLLSAYLRGLKVKRPRTSSRLALARACAVGDRDAVRAKLRRGANLGAWNASNLTPLHLAALTSGSVELVRELIAAGAEVDAALTRDVENMKTYVAPGANHGRHFQTGDTPLHSAVSLATEHWCRHRAAQSRIGIALLEAGANPNAANGYGRRPLDALRYGRDEPEQLDLIRALLAAGADPGPDASGYSALGHAAERSLPVTRILLAAGADPTTVDTGSVFALRGGCALHFAALNRHPESEELLRLVVAAADTVEVRNADGVTPLHVAAARGFTAGVALLLAAGADPAAETAESGRVWDDVSGRDPLALAESGGHVETAAVLRSHLPTCK